MAVEFSSDGPSQEDPPKQAKISIVQIQTERVQTVFVTPDLERDQARRADRKWVRHMAEFAVFAGKHHSTLAICDGVTSHMIIFMGLEKDADDYLVVYFDPWPQEWGGSFLQEGKNTAGCTATPVEGKEGFWTIKVEELFRVLDYSITMFPRELDEKTKHKPGDS